MRHADRLILALAFVAGTAGAQVPPTNPTVPPPPPAKWTEAQIRQAFEMADTDSNGQLSRAEAQRLPAMPRSFEDLDANKDGSLVLDEFMAGFRS